MIGEHLKKRKKAYAAERRGIGRRYRLKKNSDWRKRWLPFIKYDHDFDGAFLIELMVQKLNIMLDYYEHGKYCAQADESRLQIVDSLKEACRLGDMILDDDFDHDAYEFLIAHHKTKIVHNEDGTGNLQSIWDSPENEVRWNALDKAADAKREQTITEFFDYIRKHYAEWWD